MNFESDKQFMEKALQQAQRAYQQAEVPVGAIAVDMNGKVIASAFNEKEISLDPCAHSEVLLLKRAAKNLQSWRLTDLSVYVTLEPCPMCLAAMVQARIKNLIFGAYDAKGGALSLGYWLHEDSRLNHGFSVRGGVLAGPCSLILKDFFKARRG